MNKILNIFLIVIDVLVLLVIITGVGSPKTSTLANADNAVVVSETQQQTQTVSESTPQPQPQAQAATEAKSEVQSVAEDKSETQPVDTADAQTSKESDDKAEEGYKGFASESEYQRYLFSGGYEDEASPGDESGFAYTGEAQFDEHGYYLPSAKASSLSTKEKCTMDDFDWFMNYVWDNGMPDGAEYVKNPEDVVGDWKCMVIYDPPNKEGLKAFHLCNLHIDANELSEGSITMSPHVEWDYILNDDGSKTDESDRDWYLGMGEWTEGWIGNTNANHNVKIRFYETGDGKQYGYGGISLPDVKSTGICIVRP